MSFFILTVKPVEFRFFWQRLWNRIPLINFQCSVTKRWSKESLRIWFWTIVFCTFWGCNFSIVFTWSYFGWRSTILWCCILAWCCCHVTLVRSKDVHYEDLSKTNDGDDEILLVVDGMEVLDSITVYVVGVVSIWVFKLQVSIVLEPDDVKHPATQI